MTILERLRAATGPDRELDAAIVMALCPDAIIQIYVTGDDEKSVFHAQSIGIANKSYAPHYTASIDAAMALVERMLPGWACGVDTGPKTHIGFVDPHDFQDRIFGARYTAEAATPALAILTALFSALEAKEKKDA